jgi:hypothetical protein
MFTTRELPVGEASEGLRHDPRRFSAVRSAGLGIGWMRTAQSLAEAVPPEEIDGIWLFPPVRREEREWGVAVVSRRSENERRRIYTASYMLIVRGRQRGQGKVVVEEVGESPVDVVHEIIRGVQERAGEAEPPSEIAPRLWFEETEVAVTVKTAGSEREERGGHD